MKKFRIVRFYEDGRKTLVKSGLSWEEARAWCRLQSTQEQAAVVVNGKPELRTVWFDGFEEYEGRNKHENVQGMPGSPTG